MDTNALLNNPASVAYGKKLAADVAQSKAESAALIASLNAMDNALARERQLHPGATVETYQAFTANAHNVKIHRPPAGASKTFTAEQFAHAH